MTNYRPLKIATRIVEPKDLVQREETVKAFYDAIGDDYHALHEGRFCDEILEYFIFYKIVIERISPANLFTPISQKYGQATHAGTSYP